ncbi:hypothetical protein QR77_12015 [Streptomyces sp. 150FB]|nr:hypothetical protein QR77_12015 [Streptomyces sp. 150FB]
MAASTRSAAFPSWVPCAVVKETPGKPIRVQEVVPVFWKSIWKLVEPAPVSKFPAVILSWLVGHALPDEFAVPVPVFAVDGFGAEPGTEGEPAVAEPAFAVRLAEVEGGVGAEGEAGAEAEAEAEAGAGASAAGAVAFWEPHAVRVRPAATTAMAEIPRSATGVVRMMSLLSSVEFMDFVVSAEPAVYGYPLSRFTQHCPEVTVCYRSATELGHAKNKARSLAASC